MEANSGDDEDYVEHPLTRDVQPASRAGAHVRERIEQRRAAQRERRQRMQATETDEQRADRLASNLASVRARRERLRVAIDDGTRNLELEARRRHAAFIAGNASA